MGILDIFASKKVIVDTAQRVSDVSASLSPVNTIDSLTPFFGTAGNATREEAMSIPTIARARGIICSSVASLPMVVRDRATGMSVPAPRVINDPDTRIPGAASWVWCAEDLLFYGYSYFQVTQIFADTFRVRTMERVSPERVTINTNSNSTEIESYSIDGGYPLPLSGVGSLVVFYGNDEGLLNRAGRTIRTGAELERAALNYAREPLPSMVLKSTGTALPADRIAKLLEAWGASRRNRTTAFLNSDIELQALGFDPEKLQLATAREYIATELARAIGIPAYFVDANTGSSMTYSNATTSRQTLLDFSLIPIMNSISSRLSQSDFISSTQIVEFDLTEYLRGDAKTRAEIYSILYSVGAITTEEIRKAEDMIQ